MATSCQYRSSSSGFLFLGSSPFPSFLVCISSNIFLSQSSMAYQPISSAHSRTTGYLVWVKSTFILPFATSTLKAEFTLFFLIIFFLVTSVIYKSWFCWSNERRFLSVSVLFLTPLPIDSIINYYFNW